MEQPPASPAHASERQATDDTTETPQTAAASQPPAAESGQGTDDSRQPSAEPPPAHQEPAPAAAAADTAAPVPEEVPAADSPADGTAASAASDSPAAPAAAPSGTAAATGETAAGDAGTAATASATAADSGPAAKDDAAPAAEAEAAPAAETEAAPAAKAAASTASDAAGAAAATAVKEGDTRDFATILAEFERQHAADPAAAAAGAGPAAGGAAPAAATPGTPSVGRKVSGKIISITEEQIFVDLGTKSEGMIEAAQLRDAEGKLTVNVGDSLDAIVTAIDPESGVIVLRKKASGRGGHQEVATELRQAFQYGMPVEGLVTGINKGGAEVQVYGLRAFCPLSQLDLRYVENPQQFIGQRLKFKVSRIEEGSRNRRPDVVLSRRALLEEEAQAKAADLRARLQIGAVLKGRVTSLTTYGAFIDLGGLEGLLHVSEIGYARLADPREALAVGQEIEVQVIKIEKGKDEKRPERISLSRRALERDPWRDAAERFTEGTVVPGRVMRLESFGAFVEVAPGLEGLVHVSELGAGRRLNHAREAVQVGQDVSVRVLNVDPAKRRISLSMALAGDREAGAEPAAREREGGGGGGGGRDRGDRGERSDRGEHRGGDRDRDRDRGDRGDRGGDRDRDREPAGVSQQPASFGALGDFFKSSGQRRK
jgi:small subunit ribosomal protein S1